MVPLFCCPVLGVHYNAPETKVDFKKALKKLYKWLLGENRRYPELVEWIGTFSEMKEIPALSREEVQRLVSLSIDRLGALGPVPDSLIRSS